MAERAAQAADAAFSESALPRGAAASAQDVAAQLRGAQGIGPRADKQRRAARDLDCLTDAVYFEARGESKRGQQAVATVVLNRVKNPNFPKSVCGVVFQRASSGCQFSFACDGSMRHGRDEDAWEQARRVAARALSGYVLRDIGSATHFHTIDVSPDWGSQMLKVAQVGLHVFYRRNPHAESAPELQPQPQPAVFTSGPGAASRRSASPQPWCRRRLMSRRPPRPRPSGPLRRSLSPSFPRRRPRASQRPPRRTRRARPRPAAPPSFAPPAATPAAAGRRRAGRPGACARDRRIPPPQPPARSARPWPRPSAARPPT